MKLMELAKDSFARHDGDVCRVLRHQSNLFHAQSNKYAAEADAAKNKKVEFEGKEVTTHETIKSETGPA